MIILTITLALIIFNNDNNNDNNYNTQKIIVMITYYLLIFCLYETLTFFFLRHVKRTVKPTFTMRIVLKPS